MAIPERSDGIKEEVLRVIKDGNVPMNTDELMAASIVLKEAGSKLVRNALIELNNAGVIALLDHRFSYVSPSLKREQENAHREFGESRIALLEAESVKIKDKLHEINDEMGQVKKRINEEKEDAVTGPRKEKPRHGKIVDFDSDMDTVRGMQRSIRKDENEMKRLLAQLVLNEAKIAMFRETLDSYEWKPSPIDENFDDGCGMVDVTYRYIMEHYKDQKVLAVKYYREQTGLGLREASDAVDAMFGGYYVPSPLAGVAEKSDMTSAEFIEEFIRANFTTKTKVEAIKYYREQTGLGLREAKDAIDNILGK